MCVRRSTRVAYVAVLVGPAVFAAAGTSKAQSLSELVAAPTSRGGDVPTGNWSTVTQPDPPKPPEVKFDHWEAKITVSKPSLKPLKKIAAATAEPPYALHGPLPGGIKHAMRGIASYYGSGKRTATGEIFNPNDLTAAHRTLPFGTRVRVTRVDNGDSVIVRINDRGPFKPGRVIDLSRRAAEDLRMTDRGLTAVKLEVVNRGEEGPSQNVQSHLAENVAQRSLRR